MKARGLYNAHDDFQKHRPCNIMQSHMQRCCTSPDHGHYDTIPMLTSEHTGHHSDLQYVVEKGLHLDEV